MFPIINKLKLDKFTLNLIAYRITRIWSIFVINHKKISSLLGFLIFKSFCDYFYFSCNSATHFWPIFRENIWGTSHLYSVILDDRRMPINILAAYFTGKLFWCFTCLTLYALCFVLYQVTEVQWGKTVLCSIISTKYNLCRISIEIISSLEIFYIFLNNIFD